VIIRILGEGRYDVPESQLQKIEQLDSRLVAAIDGDDEAAFSATLAELIKTVRGSGKLVPADDVQASSQVVPHEGSTLSEVKELLAQET
jgi:hypothetical protein